MSSSTIKIATWNVNSIRARADRIENWLEKSDIDVLAVQETKAKDDNFPWLLFENLGYDVAHFGFSHWNGVAIASRIGLEDVQRTFPDQPGFSKDSEPIQEARAISGLVGKTDNHPGIRLWSLYVPNGRALDDPHMQYKLQWLKTLRQQSAKWLDQNPHAEIALAGDWNIAPLDTDVWDIKEFENSTHVSDAERKAYFSFLEDAQDSDKKPITETAFSDVVREYKTDPSNYTYWDYQQLRFPKKEGMRIDFILTSAALTAKVVGADIDYEERKGKNASDHVPVIIEVEY